MNNTNIVVKSNALNAYTLFKSSTQLKIFSQLIVEIRKNPDSDSYKIRVSDIIESF
jgi:hypothetical protein